MKHVITQHRQPRSGVGYWKCTCGKQGFISGLRPVEETMDRARRHVVPKILGSVPRIHLKGGRS